MSSILFLAHTEADGGLSKTTREALSGAMTLSRHLQAELTAGLIGTDVSAAADSIAASPATTFLAVQGEDFAQPRYASDAAAAEALCRESAAEIVIAPATSRFSRVLPGVAHRLGGRADTQVTGLTAEDGAPAIIRWFYRQRMLASMTRTQRPWVITIAPCCFLPAEDLSGEATLTTLSVDLPDAARRTRVEGIQAPAASEQTIRPDADLLFVAGAGWTKKQPDGQAHIAEAEQTILAFLDRAKASLGSSKSLVDLSGEGQAVLPFMTHLHQVGQTGSTPRHPKGLSTCCHGEEPHVVGWRFITERRAINLDAGCGWAQGKADVLYVADAFKVMDKVNELLAG